MSDRNTLIDQGSRAIYAAVHPHAKAMPTVRDYIEALIDAGWRPPEHVEASLRKTFRHYFISSNAMFEGFEDEMSARWAEMATEHVVAGCPFERVWGDPDA